MMVVVMVVVLYGDGDLITFFFREAVFVRGLVIERTDPNASLFKMMGGRRGRMLNRQSK